MAIDTTAIMLAATNLYPAAAAPLKIRTIEDLSVHDPLQDRNVEFRLHVPNDPGSYPLIVFSHGSLCSYAGYDLLTTFWAQRGYVVLMPRHLDAMENPPPDGPPDLQKLLSSRIRDLTVSLDAVSELAGQAPELAGCAAQPAAAAGHSFGALTAAIKVGLRLNPGAYLYDEPASDERFKAAVNMSGVGALPPLADDAFAHLKLPLLATGGTLDEGNIGAGPVFPWEWRMSAFELAPPGDKYSLVLDQADHYLGGLIARDDRGGDPDPAGVGILAAVTTAFFDAYLREQQTSHDWLTNTDIAGLSDGRATFTHK